MLPEVWDEIDDEVIGCLTCGRPLAPGEVGAKLGISEASATSLLCLLAQQGRVRICLVSGVDRADADGWMGQIR